MEPTTDRTITWEQVDKTWWRSEVGYIRQVVWNGRVYFVGWRHFEKPKYYYNLQAAKKCLSKKT